MSDILIVCAIDENDMVIGTYAVDSVTKELPGVAHARVVDFPDEPQPTGEFTEVIDPDGTPALTEIKDWPDTTWANVPTAGNQGGWVKRKGRPKEHGPWVWDEATQDWVRA
jgi:hypothetical protein